MHPLFLITYILLNFYLYTLSELTYALYNNQPSEGGTVYLESGSSGSKQEKPLAKQSYQEISISPQPPTYSTIKVTDSEISVTARAIGESGKAEEMTALA